MAIQYYKIQNTGQIYQLDKATGQASPATSIPAGAPTIAWTAQGLPPELQNAMSAPTQPSQPANTPIPAVPSSQNTSNQSAVPAAQQWWLSPQDRWNLTAPKIPDSIYSTLQSQLQAGLQTPDQEKDYLKMLTTPDTGMYSGTPTLPFYKPGFNYKDPGGASLEVDNTGNNTIKRSTTVTTVKPNATSQRNVVGGLVGTS